jgi:ubiquinone/menaquinone biosynthesis C-methylase UbiE
MDDNEQVAHSQDYFGDYRDFWWNADFVQLMSTRPNWVAAERVLEIGCGAGHWTRTIAPYLSPYTSLTAIDRVVRSAVHQAQSRRWRGLEGDLT